MFRAFLILTVLGSTVTALADEEHSDIEVAIEGGSLVVEPSPEGFVFEGEFGEGVNPGNFAAEPGFEVDDGLMQPGDALGFNIAEDLLYWNGTSFAPVPGGQSLSITKSIFSATLDGAGDAGPGFVFANADAGGGIHEDLDFTLLGPGAPDSLVPGAYGLWLELTSPQYGTSNEFIIMLNYQLDETAFEAGVEAAAALVPEPGSLLLLTAGLLALRRRP